MPEFFLLSIKIDSEHNFTLRKGALKSSRGYGLTAIMEVSSRLPTLCSSTVLTHEIRFQQNPFLRPTVDNQQEFHVVPVNLTARNEVRFISADLLQSTIFKVKKLLVILSLKPQVS